MTTNALPRPQPQMVEPQAFTNQGLLPDVLTPTGQQVVISGHGLCSPDLISDARNAVGVHQNVLGLEINNGAAGTAMVIPQNAGTDTLFSAGPGQSSASFAAFGMGTNPSTAAIPESYSSTYDSGSPSANQNCQRMDFGVFVTIRTIFQYSGAAGGETYLNEFDNQSPYPEQLWQSTAYNTVLSFRSKLFNCTYVLRPLAQMPGFGGLVGGSTPQIGRLDSLQYLPFSATVISAGQNAGDLVNMGARVALPITITNNAMVPSPAPRGGAPATEARAVVSYNIHRVGATVSISLPGMCGPSFGS